jgi:putative ABC transport system permease protein
MLVMPITTAQRKVFGTSFQGSVRMIMVKAASPEVMPAVEKSITALLRQRHRIRESQDNDFTLRNLTAVADSAAETTRVMSLLLGAIASVSLLVGGIGIMNIMLVSVTERTREIGIRMAIGAREKRHPQPSSCSKPSSSRSIGCLIGLLLGVGGAALVNVLANDRGRHLRQLGTVAFGVAAGIGVFFGFYPARKAAALDPIEALRYQ